MRINHNITALNTYRMLDINNTNSSKAIQKLSSGLRINSAADDAAGLAISEKMRGQIRGLDMATQNAQDGISLIQTAEGALNETHSILQRMRELSVQASNDTATDSDRSALQQEVGQLKQEIDRISNTTEFNTKKLLNGDLSAATKAQGDILDSAQMKLTGVNLLGTPQNNAVKIGSGNNTISFSQIDPNGSGLSGSAGANTFTIVTGTNDTLAFTDTSGNTQTITISGGTYTAAQLATKLQSGIQGASASGSDQVTVTASGNKLKFTNNETGNSTAFTIDHTSNLAAAIGISSSDLTITSGLTDSGAVTYDSYRIDSSNNQFAVNGTVVTIASGDYTSVSALATAINSGLTTAGISGLTAASGTVGHLKFTASSGKSFTLTNASGDSTVTSLFGATSGDKVIGSGAAIATHSVTITSGYYTASGLAAAVQSALSGSGLSGIAVTVQSGSLKFATTGNTNAYSIAVASGLGINSSITLSSGGASGVASGDVKMSAVHISGNNQFKLTPASGSAITVTIANGNYSLSGLVAAINSGLAAASGASGITASVKGSGIEIDLASGITKSYTIANASGDTTLTSLGITSGSPLNNSITDVKLTDLMDQNGNDLGIKSGDTITINGQVNGTDQTTVSLTVSGGTTVHDLTNKIAQELGLSSGSVTITSSGSIQIDGKSGESNALQNVKFSISGNSKFNNFFSNFSEIQDAQDNKTNNSLSFQIGANQGQTMQVDISEMSVGSLSLSSVDISTQQGAENSITVVNNAIEKVSTERAKLGAYQNRLEHSINNLGTSSQNMTAAESRIRDVDMAKEMMDYTKNNILAQASQAMLAQANQQPQGVLQLLR